VAVDYCRVFYVTQTLQSCAEAAALAASGTAQSSSALSREQAGKNAAVANGTTLNPVCSQDQGTVPAKGGDVTVTLQYEYPLLTSLLTESSTIVLQRSARMSLAPQPGE